MVRKYRIRKIAAVCSTEDKAIAFMQRRRLLHRSYPCPHPPCNGRPMAIQNRKSHGINGKIWRCSKCKRERSLLGDSYFSKTKLPFSTLIWLMYEWSNGTPVNIASFRHNVSDRTVVDFYQFFRDVCSWKLLQQPIRLGGLGTTVQVDESLLVKAKYHRGRNLHRPERWVFGIYDPQKKIGYIEFVPRRDAQTLLPIVQRVVEPGTTIHSDMWRAYSGLPALGYGHGVVNHSLFFVDPVTRVHTQNVEAYWSRAKRKFKSMNGTRAHLAPSYLDEFLWKERHARKSWKAFGRLMKHISQKHRLR